MSLFLFLLSQHFNHSTFQVSVNPGNCNSKHFENIVTLEIKETQVTVFAKLPKQFGKIIKHLATPAPESAPKWKFLHKD